MSYFSVSGFSVGSCTNEQEGYLLPTWVSASISTECSSHHQGESEKVWTKCYYYVYSHALLKMSLEAVGIAPPSLPAHHGGPATRDFQSFSSRVLLRTSFGFVWLPSTMIPVLCYGLVLWSPPSELVVVLPCMLRYSCHPLLTGFPMCCCFFSSHHLILPYWPLTSNDTYLRYCITINV